MFKIFSKKQPVVSKSFNERLSDIKSIFVKAQENAILVKSEIEADIELKNEKINKIEAEKSELNKTLKDTNNFIDKITPLV